ncbi:MerR family DNA-binding transcriptional regulator [Pseudonocardia sp. TMWB2A]|uniref:MerR family transcriptional regulator n=1 Tax=Pseudonocardia sp. TMWB2A TaxID=687430 RepID=UPI00307F23E1
MGQAAEIIGVSQKFLRSLEMEQLIVPLRTSGGHRRYSRDELRTAIRAKHLLADGHNLTSITRIITLENELNEATEQSER